MIAPSPNPVLPIREQIEIPLCLGTRTVSQEISKCHAKSLSHLTQEKEHLLQLSDCINTHHLWENSHPKRRGGPSMPRAGQEESKALKSLWWPSWPLLRNAFVTLECYVLRWGLSGCVVHRGLVWWGWLLLFGYECNEWQWCLGLTLAQDT